MRQAGTRSGAPGSRARSCPTWPFATRLGGKPSPRRRHPPGGVLCSVAALIPPDHDAWDQREALEETCVEAVADASEAHRPPPPLHPARSPRPPTMTTASRSSAFALGCPGSPRIGVQVCEPAPDASAAVEQYARFFASRLDRVHPRHGQRGSGGCPSRTSRRCQGTSVASAGWIESSRSTHPASATTGLSALGAWREPEGVDRMRQAACATDELLRRRSVRRAPDCDGVMMSPLNFISRAFSSL